MAPQDLTALIAGIFILGMVWLRTRTFYTRQRRGPIQITREGRIFFAAIVALLVIGWLLSPTLGKVVAPAMPANATLVRVVWFLVVYYLCIPVHRILNARKIAVFQILE
jgi:hypothetical protein